MFESALNRRPQAHDTDPETGNLLRRTSPQRLCTIPNNFAIVAFEQRSEKRAFPIIDCCSRRRAFPHPSLTALSPAPAPSLEQGLSIWYMADVTSDRKGIRLRLVMPILLVLRSTESQLPVGVTFLALR